MKRVISFERAKSQYPHRYTLEHIPNWARSPSTECGQFYAPHYRTDKEWYDNTKFKGEHELADKEYCYSSGQTWPLGKGPLDKLPL